jgi:hypothetical protein
MSRATVVDTIKDTIKLIQLLVTPLNGDKILLSSEIEIIGIDCGFRELGSVSWILMLININKPLGQAVLARRIHAFIPRLGDRFQHTIFKVIQTLVVQTLT